jgi:tRNA threonylcarbamoyladenosine biosynthesis protein TsaE
LLKKYKSDSSSRTESIAGDFSKSMKVGEIAVLCGPLGAGKTTFVRGFLDTLGYKGNVRSPSYTIANKYPSTPPVTHIDLYRLSHTSDLIGLDLETEKQGRILLIEWGDRFEELLDEADWKISISFDSENDNAREIVIINLSRA